MGHQDEPRREVPCRTGVSRIGVLDGPRGRRRWPDEVKAQPGVESLVPGARVCDVARMYGLIARPVSQWRGLARKRKLVLPVDCAASFGPLGGELVSAPGPDMAQTGSGVIRIGIGIAGAVRHVASDCGPDRAAAAAVAAAVRLG